MSTIGFREMQKRIRNVVRSFEAGPSSTVMVDGQLVACALSLGAGARVRADSGRIPGNFSRYPLTTESNTCTIASCP